LIRPDKEKNLKIAILGAGRLGTTIGYVINDKEKDAVKVVSISSPSKRSIDRAKTILGDRAKGILFTKNNQKAAELANTIFICTPDDKISSVCQGLYEEKNDAKRTVIHFSGSKPLDVLESAREKGDTIASIHPLKSFASVTEAAKTIKGTEYGVTYIDREGERITKSIVGLLEGNSIFVKDDAKPVYHAAACVASNYLVTLINYAVFLNQEIGIEPQASTRGLLNLIEGTIKNIKKMGTRKSLTGPIARGDTGTIEDHLKMFDSILDKKDTGVYRFMGTKTAELARENKWIDEKTHKKLIDLFEDRNDPGKEK
jgi:predicted short-subunit dehydrogenase-like oxidoreductase (DUF2520 family)